MRVFVTGGTGFIGKALVGSLVDRGDQPVVLTRKASRARGSLPPEVELVEGDSTEPGPWQGAVEGCDAAVNLAGEPMDARRWDARFRQRIHDSRVDTTRLLVEAMATEPERRPRVLVSASGVDYYPFAIDLGGGSAWDEDDEVDETVPPGDRFLARVCRHWEEEARDAEEFGARVVLFRQGMVLGPGGALPRMVTPYRFYVGGPLGKGRQWTSWIHIDDVVRAFLFALDNENLRGAFNLVAPETLRNRELCRALGRALRRPCWLPVPAFVLKLVLGELSEYVLNGRRVVPKRLLDAGFVFAYPEIDAAFRALFPSGRPAIEPRRPERAAAEGK